MDEVARARAGTRARFRTTAALGREATDLGLGLVFIGYFAQSGDLFDEALEADARKALENRRKLADDLRDVARQLAGAAWHSVAGNTLCRCRRKFS